jgi:rhomboid protease GluP
VRKDFGYYKHADFDSQGDGVPIPARWQWKLDRWRDRLKQMFGSSDKSNARPKMCPACGSLAGTTATKCYNCGASLRFSVAAVSRSLSRLVPTQSPITYAMLSVCCLFYGISLLLTLHNSNGSGSSGMGSLFGMGGIDAQVLIRMGSSLPLPYMIFQPWRLVTACFLHGSLLHIIFNMWVLMDLGPVVEELYGSARYFFLYMATGIAGYVVSATYMWLRYSSVGGFVPPIPSIGASGALLGLIGLLLAATTKRGNAAAQALRSQLIKWVIYIFILGILMSGTDNAAHFGGLACGYLLGRVVADRQPMDAAEHKRAYALGWITAVVIVACFAFMFFDFYRGNHPAAQRNVAHSPNARIELGCALHEPLQPGMLRATEAAGNRDTVVYS